MYHTETQSSLFDQSIVGLKVELGNDNYKGFFFGKKNKS